MNEDFLCLEEKFYTFKYSSSNNKPGPKNAPDRRPVSFNVIQNVSFNDLTISVLKLM